jgi:hypothetical protein
VSRTILVIPGLGGHPAFHEHLISGLKTRFTVCTAPHLDFAKPPCVEWTLHVKYWEDQLHQATQYAQAPPAIVGISFGAHVAHAIRLHRCDGRPGAPPLVLISYRHLIPSERRLLSRLSVASPLEARLIGEVLFRWSEAQGHDRGHLLALRDELYDDNDAVRARLAARLAALASAPLLEPAGDSAMFIFGSRERVLRWRHTRRGGTNITIPGGHSVSIRPSPELLRTVVDLLDAGTATRWEEEPSR